MVPLVFLQHATRGEVVPIGAIAKAYVNSRLAYCPNSWRAVAAVCAVLIAQYAVIVVIIRRRANPNRLRKLAVAEV